MKDAECKGFGGDIVKNHRSGQARIEGDSEAIARSSLKRRSRGRRLGLGALQSPEPMCILATKDSQSNSLHREQTLPLF